MLRIKRWLVIALIVILAPMWVVLMLIEFYFKIEVIDRIFNFFSGRRKMDYKSVEIFMIDSESPLYHRFSRTMGRYSVPEQDIFNAYLKLDRHRRKGSGDFLKGWLLVIDGWTLYRKLVGLGVSQAEILKIFPEITQKPLAERREFTLQDLFDRTRLLKILPRDTLFSFVAFLVGVYEKRSL